jgi:hypothetical protein
MVELLPSSFHRMAGDAEPGKQPLLAGAAAIEASLGASFVTI